MKLVLVQNVGKKTEKVTNMLWKRSFGVGIHL